MSIWEMMSEKEVPVGALGKFEKGVENAVASVFSRAFQSELKPVEITSAVKKAMDDNASAMSRERTISPNYFVIALSPKNHEQISQWSEEALAEEISQSATNYAVEQDYALVGPVVVKVEVDPEIRPGTLKVSATIKRGPVAPVTTASQTSKHPIIEIGPDRYLLTGEVTVIGRGSECDITIDDSGISRRHMELRVTPNGVIVTDLGSTNGTFVESHMITAATLVDGNTITIGRTHIMFWNAPENA